MAEFVTREDYAKVAHIQINRPEARNAIDNAVARQLGKTFAAAESDPEVRVLILSGAGRGFSAGLDLNAYAENGDDGEDPAGGFAGIAQQPPPKPIIAAVEGFALARGFEIALACDMLVAASSAHRIARSYTWAGGGWRFAFSTARAYAVGYCDGDGADRGRNPSRKIVSVGNCQSSCRSWRRRYGCTRNSVQNRLECAPGNSSHQKDFSSILSRSHAQVLARTRANFHACVELKRCK